MKRLVSTKTAKAEILFSTAAISQMAKVCESYPSTETGGVLVGRIVKNNGLSQYLVRAISGPGVHAICQPCSFMPDIEHYKAFLSSMLARYGFAYVGEWHKHPGSYCDPSHTDLDCMRKIMKEEKHDDFLCVIVNELPALAGSPLDIHGYILAESLNGFDTANIRLVNLPSVPDKPHGVAFVGIERNVLNSFLSDGKTTQTIPGIYYGEGCVRFPPLPGEEANTAGFLMKATCGDLEIRTEAADVFVTVKEESGELLVRAHCLTEKGEFAPVPTTTYSASEDCFSRNAGILETHVLREKRAVLLGLGSVGSTVAVELAKAGLGKFVLIDSDRLSPANVSRHVCDLRSLGRLKVSAVGEKLQSINPVVSIVEISTDVTMEKERFEQFVADSDVLIVSTDTAGSRALANEICIKTKTPCVFISIFERANSGDIQLVIPHRTGCRACLGRSTQDLPRGPVAYSDASTERDANVQPGMSADIGLVSLLGTRIALQVLSDKTDSISPFIRWQTPFSIMHVADYPPKENCPVCGMKPIEKVNSAILDGAVDLPIDQDLLPQAIIGVNAQTNAISETVKE